MNVLAVFWLLLLLSFLQYFITYTCLSLYPLELLAETAKKYEPFVYVYKFSWIIKKRKNSSNSLKILLCYIDKENDYFIEMYFPSH